MLHILNKHIVPFFYIYKTKEIYFFLFFQTWLYNQSVYDLNTKHNTCYSWMEYDAERGSDEIASCLYHWITNRYLNTTKKPFKKLRVFMDNCAGKKYLCVICIIVTKLNIFTSVIYNIYIFSDLINYHYFLIHIYVLYNIIINFH